jgi:translocation and assembly module TamB
MTVDGASVRYPAGFLLRGDAELTLQATAEGRQIRGEIELDRLDYVQDIDLAPTQIVQRFLTRTRLQVDETDPVLASTHLAIAVDAPGALRVRNNLARLDGSVDLTLRGTLANPVLFGEVTTREGGTISYGGNDYQLERGTLTFANPSRPVPIVDFVARTEIDDYELRLDVGGSLDRLTTNFSSNPPLSEYDVLALLATGSTTGDELFSGTASDGANRAQAAESLLYGQAAALIGQRVGTLFGVDRLQIEPLTTGETVSAARVTVGKRLSRRIYVTYSVDPTSTAQQILEVEWRLSDELTLVLTQNGDGSYALDTRWGRRF